MANQIKQGFVDEIVTLLEGNKNFVLVTFDKTPHQKLEALRKDLVTKDAEIRVIKNTLLEKAVNKLAIKNKAYSEFKKKVFPLKQVTALLVLKNDWSVGLKAFYQYAEKEKSLTFKNGMVDDLSYDTVNILKLAKLPSKNQLVANILGSFMSPTTHFVYAIKNPLQKLVYILNAKSKTN